MANCKACHHQDMLTDWTGPPLGATIFQRDKEWWMQATRNFGRLLTEGNDTTAKRLYREYSAGLMPSFEHLSTQEILDIYEYIKWKAKQS